MSRLSVLLLLILSPLSQASCPDNTGDKRALWGDLHIHTYYSMDAYVFGARKTPDDAYAFARGKMLDPTPGGKPVQLDRPLDFAAVTDHGEYLAVTRTCRGNEDLPYCRELNASSRKSGLATFRDYFLPPLMAQEPICPEGEATCATRQTNAWEDIQRAARDANEPCEFTAFIGNEWSLSPGNLHWHRNHIYATDVVPTLPVNALHEADELAMWRALNTRCLEVEGCDVIAIPHNSNIGMGGSFREVGTEEARSLRARLERLAEIYQHKGQSECFPESPLSDDECDFEIMLPVPVTTAMAREGRDPTPEELTETATGYLRDTLARGLEILGDENINPFRYGLIASTDTHGARAGYVEEEDWQGTFNGFDSTQMGREARPHYSPGGLVGVWAVENTREAVFAALKRRETFATSGPRIQLRFKQAFDEARLCDPHSAAAVQGGIIKPTADAPRFTVIANADYTPLARVDIIKLTLVDDEIRQHIQSFEATGRTSTCVSWEDESYVPGQPTLWYARVLQQPTPRWSHKPGQEKLIQERAWSSPIWSR